jgi:hypothetical protein
MIGIKSRLNEKAAAPSESNFNRAVSTPAGACLLSATSQLNKPRNSALTHTHLPGIKL